MQFKSVHRDRSIMDDSTPPRTATAACARTRLAESDVAAVDACDCGLVHLHLGPLSLRMTPTSLHGLLLTLAQATGHTVALPSAARSSHVPLSQVRRGEA